MKAISYHVVVLGLLAQLGCASSHDSKVNDTPPMLGAATATAPETDPPSPRVPPGYAAIPVSHADAVRLMAAAQDSLEIPKVQPGRGIDFDREVQSCLDMMPDSVRVQVEQAQTSGR